MVIEWLKFQVSLEAKQKFIEADDEIWTEILTNQEGYLGKETWLNPSVDNEIIIIIYWNSREEWKAVPRELLDKTESKFAQAVGQNNYQMIESLEYQMRKFRQV